VAARKNAVIWDVTPCDFVRTDVSEERVASIIRVTRIGELGTTLVVTSDRTTLRRNTVLYTTLIFPGSVFRLLVAANVSSSPILVTMMMEGLSSVDVQPISKRLY
jgi:hypothetical protein